ncbi:hypothetical protein GTP81_23585 [Rugamonas sp. FT107W]|uniref:Uncharacterized protein n=1 Tax=Duganella vulcania TaxID=2692166 RepID=A0A845HLS3_9BURK|nr:hypothetical protein [Duganella vulcania]MYN19731.1 hypothetical protein [Duganella vulcania]
MRRRFAIWLKHLTLTTCLLHGLPGVPVLAHATSTAIAPPVLSVFERDLIQTRNFIPVINHSTVVANPGDADLALIIRSPIPAELDRAGPFWPRFGPDATTASTSGGVPAALANLARTVLGLPERMSGGQAGYEWRSVVDGKHALVADYTNYFGRPDAFVSGPGQLQLLDLHVRSRFTASRQQDEQVLTMEIELDNTGPRRLGGLQFRLCFPETVIDAAQQTRRLWSVRAHRVQGDAVYSSVGHVDGLGRRVVTGHAATLTADTLAPGERRSFTLTLSGAPPEREDVLFPSFLIGFFEAEGGPRLWPASTVLPYSAVSLDRHYFREAAVLLPAPHWFSIHDKAVEVVAAPEH